LERGAVKPLEGFIVKRLAAQGIMFEPAIGTGVGRLLARQGVETAEWVGNTCRLLVAYDADPCGSADLIAWLQHCGVLAVAVRVGGAGGLSERTAHSRTVAAGVATIELSRDTEQSSLSQELETCPPSAATHERSML
jgi:hypothetical protein